MAPQVNDCTCVLASCSAIPLDIRWQLPIWPPNRPTPAVSVPLVAVVALRNGRRLGGGGGVSRGPRTVQLGHSWTDHG